MARSPVRDEGNREDGSVLDPRQWYVLASRFSWDAATLVPDTALPPYKRIVSDLFTQSHSPGDFVATANKAARLGRDVYFDFYVNTAYDPGKHGHDRIPGEMIKKGAPMGGGWDKERYAPPGGNGDPRWYNAVFAPLDALDREGLSRGAKDRNTRIFFDNVDRAENSATDLRGMKAMMLAALDRGYQIIGQNMPAVLMKALHDDPKGKEYIEGGKVWHAPESVLLRSPDEAVLRLLEAQKYGIKFAGMTEYKELEVSRGGPTGNRNQRIDNPESRLKEILGQIEDGSLVRRLAQGDKAKENEYNRLLQNLGGVEAIRANIFLAPKQAVAMQPDGERLRAAQLAAAQLRSAPSTAVAAAVPPPPQAPPIVVAPPAASVQVASAGGTVPAATTDAVTAAQAAAASEAGKSDFSGLSQFLAPLNKQVRAAEFYAAMIDGVRKQRIADGQEKYRREAVSPSDISAEEAMKALGHLVRLSPEAAEKFETAFNKARGHPAATARANGLRDALISADPAARAAWDAKPTPTTKPAVAQSHEPQSMMQRFVAWASSPFTGSGQKPGPAPPPAVAQVPAPSPVTASDQLGRLIATFDGKTALGRLAFAAGYKEALRVVPPIVAQAGPAAAPVEDPLRRMHDEGRMALSPGINVPILAKMTHHDVAGTLDVLSGDFDKDPLARFAGFSHLASSDRKAAEDFANIQALVKSAQTFKPGGLIPRNGSYPVAFDARLKPGEPASGGGATQIAAAPAPAAPPPAAPPAAKGPQGGEVQVAGRGATRSEARPAPAPVIAPVPEGPSGRTRRDEAKPAPKAATPPATKPEQPKASLSTPPPAPPAAANDSRRKFSLDDLKPGEDPMEALRKAFNSPRPAAGG